MDLNRIVFRLVLIFENLCVCRWAFSLVIIRVSSFTRFCFQQLILTAPWCPLHPSCCCSSQWAPLALAVLRRSRHEDRARYIQWTSTCVYMRKSAHLYMRGLPSLYMRHVCIVDVCIRECLSQLSLYNWIVTPYPNAACMKHLAQDQERSSTHGNRSWHAYASLRFSVCFPLSPCTPSKNPKHLFRHCLCPPFSCPLSSLTPHPLSLFPPRNLNMTACTSEEGKGAAWYCMMLHAEVRNACASEEILACVSEGLAHQMRSL